jgi:Kef-type K+ transport system membrane component KefB
MILLSRCKLPEPQMQYLISILLVAVAIANALNVFIRRFNMPIINGYIITGTMLGATFHIDLGDDETPQHVTTD